LPNVFKSQIIHIDHNKPFVAKNRADMPCEEHLNQLPESNERQEGIESEKAFFLKKTATEAKFIVDRAKYDAQEILIQSLTQVDKIKEEAWKNGYESGFNQGLESAKKECVCLLDEIMSIRQLIIDEREKLYNAFEHDMVKLAVEIAKKVIYERLSDDDEAFKSLVQSTVQKMRGIDFVKLWVSPFDHSYLTDIRSNLLSELKGIRDIEILRGESIKRYGCIVDTESGVLDGGVETRISQIEQALNSINTKFEL